MGKMSSTLNDGEIICPECKGRGKKGSSITKYFQKHYNICEKCNGTGKLDWIDNVLGGKNRKECNNTIDYITISTTGNATDFGDLILKNS